MPSVIQNLCDPCFASDQHVEGSPHVLTIDGLERVLILCGACEDSSLKPLRELLTEHGAKPAPTVTKSMQKSTQKYTAPSARATEFASVPLPDGMTRETALALIEEGRCVFGCPLSFTSKQGVGSHLRGVHDVSVTQLGLGKRGGIRAAEKPGSTDCDICGEFTAQTMQGLATHRARKHGIRKEHGTRDGSQQLPLGDDAPASVTAMRERSELRDRKTGKLKCPDCERQFETLRGLGGHRAREHGYVSADSGAQRKRRQRAAAAEAASA